MPTEQQPHGPFNEQAAIEELERLQRALEESRQKRKEASAAFDRFVASFHRERDREPGAQPAAWPRSNIAPSMLVREGRLSPPTLPLPRRTHLPASGVAAGVVAVIALGALVTWIWPGDEPESSRSPTVSNPAPTAAVSTASPAPRSSEPPLPTGTQSELRTLRHVWVRATIDGKRVLERELDAGARVPLTGHTIVIRAGDAGAVRVIIDGQDRGLMGETGIAVTRAYTSPANR
jgi:hypothetical protein